MDVFTSLDEVAAAAKEIRSYVMKTSSPTHCAEAACSGASCHSMGADTLSVIPQQKVEVEKLHNDLMRVIDALEAAYTLSGKQLPVFGDVVCSAPLPQPPAHGTPARGVVE